MSSERVRHSRLPARWWPYMGSALHGIDADLAALEDGGGAGGGPSMLDRLVTVSGTRITAAGTDVSGGGYTPTLEPGRIIKSGTNPNQAAYRSEVTLPNATYVRATEGWTIDIEFGLNLSGGFSSQPSTSWNVLFQLHGRLNNQTWPQPPVELNFQNGTYRISSSSHAPNAAGESIPAFSESMPRIRVPNPVGTWHEWRIKTVLGGSGRGFVNAWCDGEQVVTDWFPISGTLYAHPAAANGTVSPYSHEWIYTKLGLYGAGAHTAHRVVQHRDVQFTVADVNNVTRYEME